MAVSHASSLRYKRAGRWRAFRTS